LVPFCVNKHKHSAKCLGTRLRKPDDISYRFRRFSGAQLRAGFSSFQGGTFLRYGDECPAIFHMNFRVFRVKKEGCFVRSECMNYTKNIGIEGKGTRQWGGSHFIAAAGAATSSAILATVLEV
jgi:hypothetical protein